MNCTDARELFPAYARRCLTPFQSALFLEHCDACPSCRRELIDVSSISSTQAEKQRISRIWRGTSRSWAALKLALFQPLGIKVPLEAAGLLLVGALAFF